MKKHFILPIILLMIVAGWACNKKDTDGDLSGKEYIRGRLFLYDESTQQATNTPLSGKTVMVRYAGIKDTVNFLYSTTTDANGYFSFSNLTSGKQYAVFYTELVNGIIYAAKDSAAAPDYTMTLTAKIALGQQKGILFSVTDYSNNILKGANIYLFTSNMNAGYLAGTTDGSSYQLTTDANGHANFFTPNSVTYYVVGAATVGQLPLVLRDSVKISNSVVNKSLKLQQPSDIHFQTTDVSGNPVGNVNLCVFNSRILFKRDSCEGSNFQLVSDPFGKVDKYNVPDGKYYILGTLTLNGNLWIGRDSVTVSGGNIVTSTVKLSKK